MAQNYPSITLQHFSCHKIFLFGYVILVWGVIKHVEPGISLVGTSWKKLKHRLFHERSLVIFCLQNWVKTHKGNNFTHRIQDFGKSGYFWPQQHVFWMINKRLHSWAQHWALSSLWRKKEELRWFTIFGRLLTHCQKHCFKKTGVTA